MELSQILATIAKNRWLGPVKTKIKDKPEAEVFHIADWISYVSVNIFIIILLAWKAEFWHQQGIIMDFGHNSQKLVVRAWKNFVRRRGYGGGKTTTETNKNSVEYVKLQVLIIEK